MVGSAGRRPRSYESCAGNRCNPEMQTAKSKRCSPTQALLHMPPGIRYAGRNPALLLLSALRIAIVAPRHMLSSELLAASIAAPTSSGLKLVGPVYGGSTSASGDDSVAKAVRWRVS